MKIRILDNSLRLRLSQSEVRQLALSKSVQCAIQFSQEAALGYSIWSSDQHPQTTAIFEANEIKIYVPNAEVTSWANSEQVGLSASVKIDQQSNLKILIEKDFKCLSVRAEEDESDLFPNPDKQHLKC